MRLAIVALFTLIAGIAPADRATAQPKQLPPHLVAPTEPLSPADERKSFTVPDGFEVQLVASEPDIEKPMQMAWDATGRMWVTSSRHYPFAASPAKGTDKLFILSDFDPATGKAKKVQTFANDLDIPIGILPLPDCKSCIVSSVGEIRKYTDTNGDGTGDKMEVLFTGFGSRDTHGMYNSYTLMPDGWVYACHGFNNESTVKGKDGHEVKMHSGSTFRFRPDGSRIEVYSRGQVNPFGMTIDPWFNLYTADCHSRPITQIIPGATYQSFGKPHDGLGFAPHVTKHDHGSTGLCGLSWYDANQFPPDYQGCMFVGNVVTNRINFDRIEWQGATPIAKELPDFLSSTDRWFRPVDIKLGADGALYVSDFYNKIIGHYEVPLTYPGRDKDRGRIWRIVWKGKKEAAPLAKLHRADFTTAKEADLLNDLFHPNLTVRFLAGHQLRRRVVDTGKQPSIEPIVQKLLNDKERSASVVGWVLFLSEAGPEQADLTLYKNVVEAAKSSDNGFLSEHLTGHLVRALSSRTTWGEEERQILIDVFKSFQSVHQRRAAVEAAILHPHEDFAQPLIEILKNCPDYDTHLKHAARIALRNCLRNSSAWPKNYDAIYTDIALAIPSETTAHFLATAFRQDAFPAELRPTAAEHIARNGNADDRNATLGWLTGTPFTPAIGDAILGLFRGLQARGEKLEQAKAEELMITINFNLREMPAEEKYKPENLKRMQSTLQVLAALPTVAKNWQQITIRPETTTALGELVQDARLPIDLRVASADTLLKLTPNSAVASLRGLQSDPKIPAEMRDRLLLAFASSTNRDARLDARDALKDAPYRTAVAVGTALAGAPGGASVLLEAVKIGKAPARLLQERAILERLRTARIPNLDQQVAALTKGLPPLDQRLAELIKQRTTAFTSAKPDKAEGAKLFAKHCAACHKIGEQGGKIAPQLDGIGLRGLERLLEDTLDPNRNVDQAFRARVITTKDEKTITGLMVRVEGEVVVVADGEGKEQRIATKDIEANRETMLSPMPANFGDTIPAADFAHLVAYLLDQKAAVPKKE